MEAYSSTIHMTISTDNTKVMLLADHAPPSFMCNGQVVQQAPSFRYLGLHFHKSVGVSLDDTPQGQNGCILGCCAEEACSI